MDSIKHGREHDAVRESVMAGKALEAVADAVTRLRFGAIQLTIHEGRVVQLDVTERQRFT